MPTTPTDSTDWLATIYHRIFSPTQAVVARRGKPDAVGDVGKGVVVIGFTILVVVALIKGFFIAIYAPTKER